MGRRVVVTGIGLICAVGNTTEEVWKNLLAGKSGVARITQFDPSQFACQIAAEVKNFDPLQFIEKKELKKMGRFIHLALAATDEAMKASGLEVTPTSASRVGVHIGSGIGGFDVIEREHANLLNGGPRKISPFFIPAAIVNLAAGHVSIRYHAQGPNEATCTACTSSAHSVGDAYKIIARCDADAMIAGGTEAAGMSGDAHHITQPAENGDGAFRVMVNTLNDAKVQPEQVGYINAHGTSTDIGDKLETVAIKRAFGDYAYKVPVSSTKSMTGHLLGGAGGLESGITVLALRNQILPPTMNLDNPDPECDLDYVPNQARKAKVEYAMSNSFGFGGTNGALLFRRWDG